MTRRAFPRPESIAPRHHGWTRVADAPITASLRSSASPLVGILFLSLTVAIPHAGSCCAALLPLLPPGLDREMYFVTSSGFFLSGVFPLLCNRVSPLYFPRHFPDYEEDRVAEPVQFIGSYLLLVSGG
jgi:hypothetical protein